MISNKKILGNLSDATAYSIRVIDLIKNIVSNYYGFPITVFESKSRIRSVVRTKHATCYFIKKIMPNCSLDFIGKQIGYDHATVIHSLKQIKNLSETDKETAREITELSNLLDISESTILLSKDIDNSYYYLNMDKCHSIKCEDEKSIVFSGWSDAEVERFKNLFFLGTDFQIMKHDK